MNRRADFLLKSMNDKILPNLAEQRQAEDMNSRQQNELLGKEQNVNVRQAEERLERQQLERQYYERVLNMRTRQRGERVRS